MRYLEESRALKEESEGKEAGSLAAAGLWVGGGASDSEGDQSSSVTAVGVYGWEACFACEDGGGGRMEVVGDPSTYPMPKGVHFLGGAVVGDQEVGPVREDGEEEAHGDSVSQEGAGTPSWGGEALEEGEGGVGQGQAMVEVV